MRIAEALNPGVNPDGTAGYFSFARTTPGASVHLSTVYAVAQAITGVGDVVVTRLRPTDADPTHPEPVWNDILFGRRRSSSSATTRTTQARGGSPLRMVPEALPTHEPERSDRFRPAPLCPPASALPRARCGTKSAALCATPGDRHAGGRSAARSTICGTIFSSRPATSGWCRTSGRCSAPNCCLTRLLKPTGSTSGIPSPGDAAAAHHACCRRSRQQSQAGRQTSPSFTGHSGGRRT